MNPYFDSRDHGHFDTVGVVFTRPTAQALAADEEALVTSCFSR